MRTQCVLVILFIFLLPFFHRPSSGRIDPGAGPGSTDAAVSAAPAPLDSFSGSGTVDKLVPGSDPVGPAGRN